MESKNLENMIQRRGELMDQISDQLKEIEGIEKALKAITYQEPCTYKALNYKMAVTLVRQFTTDYDQLEKNLISFGLKPENFKSLQWDLKNPTLMAFLEAENVKKVTGFSQRISFK